MISFELQLSFLARSFNIFFVLVSPSFPVHAFALPELMKIYFGLELTIFFFDMITGAAANLFSVKISSVILSSHKHINNPSVSFFLLQV